MKRKIIEELIKWKTEDSGKPILLTGLKGVGKTYLAYDFAKAFFECICYVNLRHDRELIKLLSCKNPDILKEKLVTYLKLDESLPLDSRIIILDETEAVNVIPDLLTAGKISEIFRYIILISGKAPDLKSDRIVQISVNPLEFDEFLIATGNEWYIEAIVTHFNSDKKIPDIVHKELLELNRLYLCIGGMPGAINEYLNMSSVINVPEMHRFIVSLYNNDIKQNNTDSDALKMLQVYDSLANQLAKDNKKFQYKLIRKGTTHSMYKDAIQKLYDNYYVIKCSRISSQQLIDLNNSVTISDRLSKMAEWQSIETNSNFKLYYPDTGLLYSKMQQIFGRSPSGSHIKAILENHVAISLAAGNYSFAFWESEAMSKLDFVYLKDDSIIPIEIFDGENTRSKNISVLRQKYSFPYAIKISSRNFEYKNDIKYIPYYALFCL